jgi:hypothetical protein
MDAVTFAFECSGWERTNVKLGSQRLVGAQMAPERLT